MILHQDLALFFQFCRIRSFPGRYHKFSVFLFEPALSHKIKAYFVKGGIYQADLWKYSWLLKILLQLDSFRDTRIDYLQGCYSAPWYEIYGPCIPVSYPQWSTYPNKSFWIAKNHYLLTLLHVLCEKVNIFAYLLPLYLEYQNIPSIFLLFKDYEFNLLEMDL